jgi:hypothetical protein
MPIMSVLMLSVFTSHRQLKSAEHFLTTRRNSQKLLRNTYERYFDPKATKRLRKNFLSSFANNLLFMKEKKF